MKLLAASLLLFLTCSFFVQQEHEQILWSKKKLKWKNFKGTVDSTGPHAKAAAVTSSRLEQRYYMADSNEIHFIIAAWFNPARSWVKKATLESRNSNRVLDHEQHHFDMCELYARKIRQYLSNTTFTAATYKMQIKDLFRKFHEDYRAEQGKYDNELANRKYTLEDWTSSIDDEMKALSKYADTLLVVKLQ